MNDRELMQQALDTLKHLCLHSRAIAGYDGETVQSGVNAIKKRLARTDREWQGLTDEDIKEIIGPWGATPIKGYTRKLFDQIEAKLKEKNK